MKEASNGLVPVEKLFVAAHKPPLREVFPDSRNPYCSSSEAFIFTSTPGSPILWGAHLRPLPTYL